MTLGLIQLGFAAQPSNISSNSVGHAHATHATKSVHKKSSSASIVHSNNAHISHNKVKNTKHFSSKSSHAAVSGKHKHISTNKSNKKNVNHHHRTTHERLNKHQSLHHRHQKRIHADHHSAIVPRPAPINQNNNVPTVPTIPATNASATINNISPTFTGGSDANNDVKNSSGLRVVSYVHQMLSNLRYTTYRSGGQLFDSQRGVYEADCSHYVDHVMQNVFPRAYAVLEMSTGAHAPDSADYYEFIRRLSVNMHSAWDKVDNATQLQPGDVLVFRYRNSYGESSGGHVMVVMDKPVLDNNALLVRVSDSAFSGHSDDTRGYHSGVGIGTLLLKINTDTGAPSAYAWDESSRWVDRVNIAMARPISLG